MNGLRLTGFQHSVYTRAVRMALFEKALSYESHEVMPFSDEGKAALAGHHGFGRVPVLQHYAFELYETAAILAYLDEGFDAPVLFPKGAKARARVIQIEGIIDAYLYWPLIRQAFSNAVYCPHFGEPFDPQLVETGMAVADQVLNALEEIASAGLILTGREITRADCHLAPMMDYFVQVPGAREALDARPSLAHWFDAISERPSFSNTRPDFLNELETTP